MTEDNVALEIGTNEKLAPGGVLPPEPALANSSRPLALTRLRSAGADLLKAHVALMEREVILPKQVDLFRLVKYHYYTLQTWHDQHTGWRIQRNPTAIRLIRQPSAMTTGYAYERLREPGDFACLTWILWYAENRQILGRGNDQQFLLSQLAEQIQQQSTSQQDRKRKLDFRRPSDRYSIQRALQYLEDLGGLQLVDGQTREWVEQASDGDALYEFTDVIRSLIAALNPQHVDLVSARLHNDTTPLQPGLLPEGTKQSSAIVRAWRALLLGPSLFKFDDPEAFDALLAHVNDITQDLLDTFGWSLDLHQEYACIVRVSGTSTGPVTSLGVTGASDQITMLLCGAMRNQVENGLWPAPDQYGCVHVTSEDVAELFYQIRERYGDNWGSEARNKSARSLLSDVYKRMRQAGLLRGPDATGNLLLLPTVARYAVTYDKEGRETTSTTRTRSKATTKNMALATNTLPGLE